MGGARSGAVRSLKMERGMKKKKKTKLYTRSTKAIKRHEQAGKQANICDRVEKRRIDEMERLQRGSGMTEGER